MAYTAADLLAAVVLTGFWIATLLNGGILLAARAAGAYCDYRTASFIEELARYPQLEGTKVQ